MAAGAKHQWFAAGRAYDGTRHHCGTTSQGDNGSRHHDDDGSRHQTMEPQAEEAAALAELGATRAERDALRQLLAANES